MPEVLLCADVGNSRTKFGLCMLRGSVADELPKCMASLAAPHAQPIPWRAVEELFASVPGGCLPASVPAVIAGSNPDSIARIRRSWPAGWNAPKAISNSRGFPIDVLLEEPERAGVDRLLNAIACNAIRPHGTPAVIVDTGTATTIDAVNAQGSFEGGAILPGVELCARALHQYTALLPLMSMDELIEESHEPLGRNTHEAMRSGLVWGQLGAIRQIVAKYAERWQAAPFLLLTGGGSPLIAPHWPEARREPNLSLQGLAIVAESPAGVQP